MPRNSNRHPSVLLNAFCPTRAGQLASTLRKTDRTKRQRAKPAQSEGYGLTGSTGGSCSETITNLDYVSRSDSRRCLPTFPEKDYSYFCLRGVCAFLDQSCRRNTSRAGVHRNLGQGRCHLLSTFLCFELGYPYRYSATAARRALACWCRQFRKRHRVQLWHYLVCATPSARLMLMLRTPL